MSLRAHLTSGIPRRVLRRAAVVGAGSLVAASVSLIAPAAYAEAPANDDWGTATVISTVPFEDSVDTTEATTDAVYPPDMGRFKAHTVWYRFTAPSDSRLLLSTTGTDYYHLMALFQVDDETQPPEEWTRVKGDRGSADYGAGIIQTFAEGEEYYLVIGTQKTVGGGTAHLLVREPAQVTVKLLGGKVDRIGGSAILRGTIVSDQSVTTYLSVTLRQAVGDWVAQGDSGKSMSLAAGEVTQWRLKIRSQHPFQVGAARVDKSQVYVDDSGARFRRGHVVRRVVTLK